MKKLTTGDLASLISDKEHKGSAAEHYGSCWKSIADVVSWARGGQSSYAWFDVGEKVLVLDIEETVQYETENRSYTMVDGKKLWATTRQIHRTYVSKILTQRGVMWCLPNNLVPVS